jgi:hypothetical protein
MTTSIRWGGIALFLGALLAEIAIVAFSFSRAQAVGRPAQYSPWVTWLFAVGAILISLALPLMYASQARETGSLGLVGFVLLEAGWVFVVVVTTAPLMYKGLPSEPGESVAAFALGTMLALGFVLTGIATLRSGVFSPGIGYLWLAAATGFVFLFFVAEFLPAIASRVGGVLFGLLIGASWAWMGVAMWTRP